MNWLQKTEVAVIKFLKLFFNALGTILGVIIYIIIAVIILCYLGIIPTGEPSADWYEESQRDPFAT